jgi:1-acyl-sn-glycerol-3-phosphate acyltransferase
MQYVRSKLFDAFLILWTLVLSAAIPYLALRQDPALVRATSRLWSKGILWGLSKIVRLTYKEIGKQNKLQCPALYVCNHQSAWETLAVSVLIPDLAIVLKEVLYKYPIFGWYLRHSPMIAINRDAGVAAIRRLIREGRQAIKDNRSVLIFPEGTRRGVYDICDFHRGVLSLYRALNVSVVPMAVNSGVFWSPFGAMKYNGEITVSYLAPLPPDLPDEEFMAQLHETIMTEKSRLISDLGIEMWIDALG